MGATSNETNLMVGLARSEGYEPKTEPRQALPAEIAPGIVGRSIEAITTRFKGRSNSSSGTPGRVSPRSPVSQRQSTGNPPITDVHACDWTSFENANQRDSQSVTGGTQQRVAEQVSIAVAKTNDTQARDSINF
eukprot:2398366-Amphidinium_carterae.1